MATISFILCTNHISPVVYRPKTIYGVQPLWCPCDGTLISASDNIPAFASRALHLITKGVVCVTIRMWHIGRPEWNAFANPWVESNWCTFRNTSPQPRATPPLMAYSFYLLIARWVMDEYGSAHQTRSQWCSERPTTIHDKPFVNEFFHQRHR